MSRLLFLLALLVVQTSCAPGVEIQAPDRVTQGEVLRITIKGDLPAGLRAKLGEKAAPFFPREGAAAEALLPVGVRFPPGQHDAIVMRRDGKELGRHTVTVVDGRFPEQNIVVSPQMRSLTPLPGEVERIRELYDTVSGERHWGEAFLVPTPDCRNSPFGVLRLHNGKYSGNYHRGLDLRSPPGRPVQAPAAGVVKIAQMYRLHGGTVGLDHGEGVTSIYIHLSSIDTKEGERVEAGAVIGRVGATGFATGPHLHWGVYVHGEPVNPLQWTGEIPTCAPPPAAAPKPKPAARKKAAKAKLQTK